MGETSRILLVEDDPAHVELIRRAFAGRAPEFVLEAAATLGEARASLRRSPPDLVLTDWKLPDGQGIELLRETGTAGLPVVVMTSHGSERVAVEALKAGALDYIVKSPESFAELPRTVARALGEMRARAERQRMQEALQRSEELLRLVAENVADAIWTSDLGLRITYVTPSVERLHGWTVAEWGSLRPEEYISQRSLGLVRQALADELAGQRVDEPHRPVTLQVEQLRRDGSSFWTEVTARFLLDASGEPVGVVGVTRDISDRLRVEEENRRLEEQLAQSQKIESVGTLAGGVAHDFNNMLSPIIGYAEMLLDELPAGDKRRSRAEAIVSAGERCRDLVHRLLAFARKQTLELRCLDLNAVVSGFETILRRTLPENIAIELRLAPAVGQVLGDSRQIEQVLLNLAVNARDAMPDGGRLRFETADVTLNEEYARAHEWVVPGHYVRLSVSDNGAGMDKETLAKVFDPFFTTKEVGKGTGLGLAMVYGIVKQHGGSVEAESEPGRGTIFRVHFPRTADAVAAATPEAESPRTRGGETILIIEDEDQVLALAAEILRIQGYTVLEAGNAAQALAAVAAHPEGIDLLLTDVILTDANGRTLHERIAAGGSAHKVLYMSGYPADIIGRHGVLAEGVALIPKPFSVSTLSAKVREVLDRKA